MLTDFFLLKSLKVIWSKMAISKFISFSFFSISSLVVLPLLLVYCCIFEFIFLFCFLFCYFSYAHYCILLNDFVTVSKEAFFNLSTLCSIASSYFLRFAIYSFSKYCDQKKLLGWQWRKPRDPSCNSVPSSPSSSSQCYLHLRPHSWRFSALHPCIV